MCPGQGAQTVGMGKAWCDASPAAKQTFDEAHQVLGDSLGAPLSTLCFEGPGDRLNRTDVAQPALYVCSVASYRALVEREGPLSMEAAAGLSLGEYTALHLAGVFEFAEGLRLVALRGRLMQEASEAADSGMVALVGADEQQALSVCEAASEGEVLVCANFNAPGQVVLAGHTGACERAVAAAEGMELRATALAVAGAFHSPLMQSAADGMERALQDAVFQPPQAPVWANVTAQPHDAQDMELLKRRLVEQIVSPVRWSEICRGLAAGATMGFHELAPGAVLRGLMRRIDRKAKVTSHDQP
ncbi:MAG: ACP S-malonyltransferase [Planctomycetota bacterium]